MVPGKSMWTSRAGVTTAIGECTGQAVDIVYENSECKHTVKWNKNKQNNEMSTLEYLTWLTGPGARLFTKSRW